MTVSEEESTSLSVNIFEDLNIIVTKEAYCNTGGSDDFTTDRKQKCSNNDLAPVTALKEHIDDSFKSIKEITESIENNNEDFKTDKRAIGNNGSGNNIVSTNINGNSTNKTSKENLC